MPMDVILVLWFCVCTARTGKQSWALGGLWGKVVVVVALLRDAETWNLALTG